ncbi:Uncharacterised protein [uncultured archaeon]|nr:Uncharacterised protein [uncultured archaeon]
MTITSRKRKAIINTCKKYYKMSNKKGLVSWLGTNHQAIKNKVRGLPKRVQTEGETPMYILVKKKPVSATVSRPVTRCKRLRYGSYTKKRIPYADGVNI